MLCPFADRAELADNPAEEARAAAAGRLLAETLIRVRLSAERPQGAQAPGA